MNTTAAYSDAAVNLGGGRYQVVPITVFVAVLCLCMVIGHLLEENRWVNESITAIIIGSLAGTVILFMSKGKSSHILRFDEELFFIYLLPPIIFNAGFQVKKKQFFHNFLTIMLFGVIGVFISTSILAAGSWWLFPKFGFSGLTLRDYLGIGTIFSSTDTVCTLQVLHRDETPLLYSLVFGEGVVNDATSVVLFNAVQKLDVGGLDAWAAVRVLLDFLYLFTTSTALGVSAGLVTAFVLRGLYFGRHSTVREIALMVLVAYFSYMLAEESGGVIPVDQVTLNPSIGASLCGWVVVSLFLCKEHMILLFNLSGILTVFFAGVLMSHYAWYNVTESSRITTKHAFSAMSFIAETFIFLYVGMDALDLEKWKTSKLSFGTSLGIYCTVMFLILLARAAFVFPLSVLSNYMNRSVDRSSSITIQHQVVIWWAGLMRGAVSIALAFKQFTYSGVTMDPLNATLVTTTVVIVLFSTVVFGFLTKPLVNLLLPHNTNNIGIHREPTVSKDELTLPMLSFEESAATNILHAKDGLAMLIDRPIYTIHRYWRRFDDTYMRPIFGGPHHSEPL